MTRDYLDELAEIRAQDLERVLRELPHTGARIDLDGREYLNFSSNDYLDLANHREVMRAAQDAVAIYGCGATASRLMTGHLSIHAQLESAIATLVRKETALLFPSGYQTNLALLSTLAGRGDTIYSDQLNHASIIDGARLSRADIRVYPHGDHEALRERIAQDTGSGRRFIVSDAIFSMDGDAAPVRELRAIADAHDALLIIDEAHAVGLYAEGAGWCIEQGVTPDVTVGTLSKSLGTGGGFVATSTTLRDYLLNRARPFIYSTGLSPANAGAGLAATRIIQQSPGLGPALLDKARAFRSSLRARDIHVAEADSPIIPIVVGENQVALDLAARLRENGIIATAIRPPTVPLGTARLRLTVTLGHSDADIARATALIAKHLSTSTTV